MEQPSCRFVKSILRVNIFSAACLMLYALALPSSVLAGRPLVIDDADFQRNRRLNLDL